VANELILIVDDRKNLKLVRGVSETDFKRFEEACKTDLFINNVSLIRADVHPDGDEET
jgi:hypothetical protein